MPAELLVDSLTQAVNGDAVAGARVHAAVYAELQKIARAQRHQWQGNETLNTSALIHEAYLKLLGANSAYANRTHFYATAAKAMHQVLVSYARAQQADKRAHQAITLDLSLLANPTAGADVLLVSEALADLEKVSPRQCQVVECRFFAGMDLAETASALGVSTATVKRDWLQASAALRDLVG